MASIEITEFKGLRPLTSGKLRAFVDVVFNDALVVKGYKIIEGSKGLFVAAPARVTKGKDGAPDEWNDVVYFTKDSGMGDKIKDKIMAHYKENVDSASNSGSDSDPF